MIEPAIVRAADAKAIVDEQLNQRTGILVKAFPLKS